MSQLFIAHGHRDVDPLLQVHEAMRRASIPTWYTPAGSKEFEPDSVMTAIDDAFGMVVLVSASSIRSKAVQEQLQIAHERGLTLFPIRTDNARLSKQFKSLLADQLTDSLADDGALERLVQQVKDRYERRCPVISVMNLKGGVGKTTVSSQVFGTWQASLGGRTLLIDLDPQYNLTQTFFDMEHADASSARDKSVISLFERSRLHAYDTISPSESWSEISTEPFEPAERQIITHDILSGEGAPGGRFDLISGQFEISKYAFAKGPEALALVGSNFRRMIDYYRSEYDLIIFDTNPNATFLTRCALEAADRVLAPMHADAYSLRGVKLLNQVMHEQVSDEKRPNLSILFNAVGRSEQSNFEADARNGAFNAQAGFDLAGALLSSALPRSGHLNVKTPEPEDAPWKQLVIHNGRGGGLKRMRETLKGIAGELKQLVDT
ncbi:MAG: AAA family ATPase [Hyphomonas sp.]|jgi:chromosome partitioning protein|nr:AAA family ATPase [Henriciella sp.]MBO6695025.1 AAA family ATPase [Henriciella sp.]MCH9751976.1 AAA family ATPase [Alphaproteobacteria bacterium]MCR9224235.1 AAA family ATPase [Hyphomonas sp.]